MRTAMFAVVFCYATYLTGQQNTIISGTVKNGFTGKPVLSTNLNLNGITKNLEIDSEGQFSILAPPDGNQTLEISAPGFVTKRFEIYLDGNAIELGDVLLEKDITSEKNDNLITLSDNDFGDDDDLPSASMGILQSTRDVFLNRAAFDFGQAFFKVRGYDSQHGQVLLNSLPMNKLWDGRPQWNHWGGLNDAIRNQEFSHALTTNPYGFGGILGTTNINTKPSGFRPGLRISSSASNRTYRGRIMATYSSGQSGSGISYAVSSSRRWAKTGYVDGTLYDAYSFFGALEYKLNPKNSLVATAVLAKNRRGRSAALTQEIYDLMGNRYNPYCGNQNGKTRNSRERVIFEPFFMLNHFMESKKWTWVSGIMYQDGITAKSRLGYSNAPNPDPTYYKNVPSYHLNGAIGADFLNMALALKGFKNHSQVPWEQLYLSNTNTADTSASYILQEDKVQERQLSAASSMSWKINSKFKLSLGANFKNSAVNQYAEIKDLLGADVYWDKDSFSNTRNDLQGSLAKRTGDRVGYNFGLAMTRFRGFGQLEIQGNSWDGFASASVSSLNLQRNGLFQNERYVENSFGKGEELALSGFGLKSGFTYYITGRHSLSFHGGSMQRPPTIQNIFVNPRENNLVVPDLQKVNITTADANYYLRLPDLTGRISIFYTRFQHETDINFFFSDTGLGSDFVQEVVTGLDRLHKGIELGMEYQISNDVKLSVVGNLGDYIFASDPNIQLYFDTSGEQQDLINLEGNVDLGVAKVKGLKLSQGPQTALALGVEYRSPKYWWMGATANYLDENYASISTIVRTNSFLLDPETGVPHPEAIPENTARLLNQQKMDEGYLLNLVGGKSWLIKGKYISTFLSVNNLFDSVFRTGGYEQSRNANFGQMQQDNLSGTPSFGPKYWFSYGRTYFLNLAISL
ncbi:MAG: TonB-dependent receptor [Bacteroidota bacterium]